MIDTKEFVRAGGSLKDIPQPDRTAELCEAAIKHDGMELQYVPLPFRTVRLTKLAIGTNARAYCFAPEGVRSNHELALFALRRGGALVWAKVPFRTMNYDLCYHAVSGCGGLLKNIASDYPQFLDYKLCKRAFTQGGADIKHIPHEFLREPDFWDGVALINIPDEFKTYDLCLSGVRKCGTWLQHVPQDLQDIVMVKAALANNAWAYRFVPSRFHGLEYVKEAYEKARAGGATTIIDDLERKIA